MNKHYTPQQNKETYLCSYKLNQKWFLSDKFFPAYSVELDAVDELNAIVTVYGFDGNLMFEKDLNSIQEYLWDEDKSCADYDFEISQEIIDILTDCGIVNVD